MSKSLMRQPFTLSLLLIVFITVLTACGTRDAGKGIKYAGEAAKIIANNGLDFDVDVAATIEAHVVTQSGIDDETREWLATWYADAIVFLDKWLAELNNKPQEFEEIMARRQTEFKAMILEAEEKAGNEAIRVASEVLDKFVQANGQVVDTYVDGVNEALRELGTEVRCNADFAGTRLQSQLITTLKGIEESNFLTKWVIDTRGFPDIVIAPVVCGVVPSDIMLGETPLIKYYGYDFMKYGGEFEAEVRHGNRETVRSYTLGIAETSNYLYQVALPGLGDLELDKNLYPEFILQWNGNDIQGLSEVPILIPTQSPTPTSTPTPTPTYTSTPTTAPTPANTPTPTSTPTPIPPIQIKVFEETNSEAVPYPAHELAVPDDYKILGGGARLNWTGAGSLLTASYPRFTNGRWSWVARGKQHIESDPATITVWAIALYDPDNQWEVRVFSGSPSANTQHPQAEVAVPANYIMTGGGAEIAPDTMNFLTASYPENNTTWQVASQDINIPASATITAYAIGIRPRDGSIYTRSPQVYLKCDKRSSSHPRSNHIALSVSFEPEYVVLGGGGILMRDRTNDSWNYLTATYPVDAASWRAFGKDHMNPSATSLTVCALGAKGIKMMR